MREKKNALENLRSDGDSVFLYSFGGQFGWSLLETLCARP